jgi:hypothetical protein
MNILPKIFLYLTVFLIIPLSFSMDNNDKTIKKYQQIVGPLKKDNLKQEKVEKIYNNLVNFLNKHSTDKNELNKRVILDSPLDDDKRLIHHIVRLSLPKKLTLNNFWNLLFNSAIQINIQDNHGNTPLLDAFYRDDETNCVIIHNQEITQLLLYYGANPMIENNQKISPAQMIIDYNNQNKQLGCNGKSDYINAMYACLFLVANNNYCNSFNK